ncbi:MAG: anhydro-N-acetylmuramic acid kinase [Bacteroidia bacterium]
MIIQQAQKYSVIGLMSGTSLDGVDIASCNFQLDNGKWLFSIQNAETIPYSIDWKHRLKSLEQSNAVYFQQTHVEYGYYLGQLVTNFVEKYNLKVDIVSSHGHTIFHQPDKAFTVQIGAGQCIAAQSGFNVVCDFRTLDVALGGQGAPLVPIGDKLLFQQYDFCLNLGGFANVSYQYNNQRIAYDICPVNIVMNEVAASLGQEFDKGGMLASQGSINNLLLDELNALPFYHLPLNGPKSLGKEWVLKNIFPIIEKYSITQKDILRTFCEHVAIQVANSIKQFPKSTLIATGGGVYNAFLMECIKNNTFHDVIIPDKYTIEFKEALIFAFLGVLRLRQENNCLKSVTGATFDNCGGAIYLAPNRY